ncbi:MAG: response regulator transcription factor [Chloroflexota bacterium]|nr:MAG: response regulator transcription factor [Chloroflexota bacterium]
MSTLILLVDDERKITELARLYLENDGFRVSAVHDGERALKAFHTESPGLVVLDLMLPLMDGYEVCRRIRAQSDVPILMLTARDEDVDKIVGLELGADDYLTKPFNPRELVARIKAILRRAQPTHKTQRVQLGALALDLDRREVTVQNRLLQLRTKEFDLLAVLVQHPRIVFTREKLLELAWGYDFAGETRTVDVHIAHLRKKLAGSGLEIETITGVGYKLVG